MSNLLLKLKEVENKNNQIKLEEYIKNLQSFYETVVASLNRNENIIYSSNWTICEFAKKLKFDVKMSIFSRYEIKITEIAIKNLLKEMKKYGLSEDNK